jgi:hypothetical protein
MGATSPIFEDEAFLDQLVCLLVRDAKTLRDCGSLLKPDDFKPLRGMRQGRARWVVAERALEHHRKYHEPVGRMLKVEVLDHAHRIGMSDAQAGELKEYCQHIRVLKPVAPESIVEKILHYKTEHLKAAALQEMTELHNTGQLTLEKWQEINQRVLAPTGSGTAVTDYLAGLQDRLARRSIIQGSGAPWTFIDPLDSIVRAVGRKQLGMVLAPYGRGKSLFLEWLAVAYVLQRLKVLYVTLEDPQSLVEDRLDSIVTKVPIASLADYPKTIAKRFDRWRAMVRAHLKIHDGTEGGVTIAQVEQIILQERNHGVFFDVVIIDYDDEIVPPRRHKERRFEFADIYREFRQMIARYNQIGWTAAQTQRGTEDMRILSGDKVAEDISKMRKVTFGISLGKGDWADDSIYLWVAKHKFDVQHVGCEIIPDFSRMLIYDREATLKAMRERGTDTT